MANPNISPDGLGETRLYRVTMVVAVHPLYCPDGHPNIEESPEGVVLYATTGGFDEIEGVQIVGEPQVQELKVTLASPAVVRAEIAPATLPEDEDSVTEALQQAAVVSTVAEVAKPKRKRKKHKKQYRPSARIAERMQKVLDTLNAVNDASADEIAVLADVPVKHVYADLYNLHDLKKVSAVKAAGKVRWFANKPASNNNNETK
jgi:hypothetical protein